VNDPVSDDSMSVSYSSLSAVNFLFSICTAFASALTFITA
jgi:hypothetical protein